MKNLVEDDVRSLCILIPCHNEERAIAQVVVEYKKEFPGADVLVVDNASTDQTAAVAREAGARVISERRKGKAKAIATAFEAVTADLIIMTDGDGSYPAAGARILLEQYRISPVDLIAGIRIPVNAVGEVFRPMHQFGTKIFSWGAFLAFGYFPKDIFTGLRLFSRRFYKNVPVLSDGFELEMELTIQAIDKGFSIYEMRVPFRERAGGTSSKLRTLRDGFKILRALLLLFRDFRPLYFFGVISLFWLILGLCAGAPPVLEYYRTGFVGRFPLAILAAALVNISIFTLLSGSISESNLRYHREAFQIRLRNRDGLCR